MKNIRKTSTGIARPKTGTYVTWETARAVARERNVLGVGRGHRALKAADGRGYGVVFRPAVTTNKQRKVREVI